MKDIYLESLVCFNGQIAYDEESDCFLFSGNVFNKKNPLEQITVAINFDFLNRSVHLETKHMVNVRLLTGLATSLNTLIRQESFYDKLEEYA